MTEQSQGSGPTLHEVPVADIVVEGRQRKEFHKIPELALSIREHGLIHPIILDSDNRLIAGERRLQAWERRWCYLEKMEVPPPIPALYKHNLNEWQKKAIELEENLQRTDLQWEEKTIAIVEYYELRKELDPDISQDNVADSMGWASTTISNHLLVGNALRQGDERVKDCVQFTAALNILRRESTRAMDVEMDSLVHGLFDEGDRSGPFGDSADTEVDRHGGVGTTETSLNVDLTDLVGGSAAVPDPGPDHGSRGLYRAAHSDITVEDFRAFARDYSGERFSFIHCDFPYGIGQHESEQSSAEAWQPYEDTPDTFFELVDCLLNNEHRLLAEHSHILFWFHMKYYSPLLQVFRHKDFIVNPRPLIWVKSDKRGILPDAQRGPRQIYETALMIRKGDRPIVRATVDAAMHPLEKSKARHYSEKPQGMLETFLAMYIDKSTAVLDPTCGGGTALAVAQKLGARSIRGMDLDEEAVEGACRLVNAVRLHQSVGSPPNIEFVEEKE